MTPIFSGELQLLRWSETSTGGATVTFQLPDVGGLDRFKQLTLAKKGMAGQIIAAVMMLVDENQPEPTPEPEPARDEPKQRPGELCIMACTFCKDADFRTWAHFNGGGIDVNSEADAKQFICEMCGIDSRKQLDQSEAAAKHFHERIRNPFMAWKEAT